MKQHCFITATCSTFFMLYASQGHAQESFVCRYSGAFGVVMGESFSYSPNDLPEMNTPVLLVYDRNNVVISKLDGTESSMPLPARLEGQTLYWQSDGPLSFQYADDSVSIAALNSLNLQTGSIQQIATMVANDIDISLTMQGHCE